MLSRQTRYVGVLLWYGFGVIRTWPGIYLLLLLFWYLSSGNGQHELLPRSLEMLAIQHILSTEEVVFSSLLLLLLYSLLLLCSFFCFVFCCRCFVLLSTWYSWGIHNIITFFNINKVSRFCSNEGYLVQCTYIYYLIPGTRYQIRTKRRIEKNYTTGPRNFWHKPCY